MTDWYCDWYCTSCEMRRPAKQGEVRENRTLEHTRECSTCGALAHCGTSVAPPALPSREDPYLHRPPSQYDLAHDPELR